MKTKRPIPIFGRIFLKISNIRCLAALVVLCLNLVMPAAVFSQTSKFNIQMKEVTVKEVFEEVVRQSHYRFFYNNEFDVNRKVTIDVKDGSIDDVVREVLKGQRYSYKIVDSYVIIKREDAEGKDAGKQERNIQGVVKDADGVPLPGVTIRVQGTTSGIATDLDGNFKLSVPDGDSFLIISFIGKKTQIIPVGKKTFIEVTLEDDKKVLDEVVCTGMQTISRERATGSFEIINSDVLNKTLTPDVVSRLEGKIAGVQIDQNNKMVIRGRGSLYSNSDPLVVVDGFPIEAGLESVNPDDIANITVLKDAAAASIWGVRAANGVIVITTKAGTRKEKPSLSVSYFLTVENKANYEDLHLLSPGDAIDLQLEQIEKGWWTTGYVGRHATVNRVQEIYYNTMNRIDRTNYNTIISDGQFRSEIKALREANLYKQFERELLRNAVSHRVNLSYQGGSERSSYYLSAVYNTQALGSVGDKDNDLLLNLKHDYKIVPKLTFSSGVNVRYNKSENNGIDITRLSYESPFHDLLDGEGKRIQYYMVDPWEGKRREEMGYLSYTTNLLDEQETNDNTTNVFSTRLQASLKWDILTGLDVEMRFQYERAYTNTEQLYSLGSPTMRGLINNNTMENNGQLTYNLPMGARFDKTRNELEAWTWRSQATYNGNWREEKHLLAVILGHEMRMYRTKGYSSIQFGYDPQALTYIPIDETAWAQGDYLTWFNFKSDIPRLNRSTEVDNRDISVYMNGSYTFLNRYSISASGRIDQSNLFGNDSDYKYNFIWSTGLSWKISEEEFARADWIDQLTLRATYGIGGNVNKQFFPALMGRKGITSSGVPYVELDNPANDDLTWEKATTLNLGVDFGFLGHRIGGSLDLYQKKSTDLLGQVSLDPTNGFPSAIMNFASVLNRGFEFTLNTTPLTIDEFTWNLGFNISYNENEVTKVEADGSTDSDYLKLSPAFGGEGVAAVGKPLGRLYSYRYAGLNDKGEPMLWKDGEKVLYTNYERLPENLKYEGTIDAPWFGGVNTSFTYKGFVLSANATYKFGNKFRLPVSSPSDAVNGYEDIADRWRTGHTDTDIPGLLNYMQANAQYEIHNYYAMSDLNIRSAAYVRLNEVALSYTLPRSVMAKIPFSSIDIQFQARNLALWTANKEHADPEAVITGDVGSSYVLPQPKSFILGFKLTF